MSEDKNNIIKHAQLDWSDQSEPFSTQFDDIYFNNYQGLNESQYVFFEGNKLQDRWANFEYEQFCIIETGFGSGLNFINTADKFLNFKQQNVNNTLKRLHFISFEKFPLKIEDLIKTLQNFPQLKHLTAQLISKYPLPLIGCHRLSFAQGDIILDLWFGDINEQIDNLTNQTNVTDKNSYIADAWYLDGFNPRKNPDMWHKVLFTKMWQHSKPDASIATFTSAGFVRRALIEAGFNIEKRKGYGKKREMLVGSINADKSLQQTTAKPTESTDIAIIGGGIASLCCALSLAKRGKQISLYCADANLGAGASGNLQGALYPLLNQQHDALGQLFANAYLFARNFYHDINQAYPFAHEFNGLIQLAYDQSATNKLRKIMKAQLPQQLLQWTDVQTTNQLAGIDINQQALFYPTAGWLSPRELIESLSDTLKTYKNVNIYCNHKIDSIAYDGNNWVLEKAPLKSTTAMSEVPVFAHKTLIIAAGFDTLKFNQCRAIPLSAARGQVTHIASTTALSPLKRTLCHEGYITPSLNGVHCMGATFKRHDDHIDYRKIEQIENHHKLKKCIPEQSWVDSIKLNDQAHIAIRCTTRDHFPYVGGLTDYNQLKRDYQQGPLNEEHFTSLPNAYLLTGLGSRGLCTAPLLGEILTSVILQESLPIDKHIFEKMKIPRQWLSYMLKNKPLKD